MRNFAVESAGKVSHYDHIFITVCVLLTGAGLVTLYSASYAFADRWFGNKTHFLTRQIGLAAMGFLCFFVASRIKTALLKAAVMPLVLLSMILCGIPFVPGLGVTLNEATRWIKIGSYTFQPSEFVKITLPLYLAYIFDKKKDKLDDFRNSILPPILVTLIFVMLVYFQNDFSTAIFIAINSLAIFFVTGVRMRYFLCAFIMLIPVSTLLVMTKEHRLLRVMSFLHPEFDPQGAGFQVASSLLTIASGGLWGKGLGQGVRKIASVPEIHSDFIFASFAEESGFIGALLFLVCFFIFALQGYRIAFRTQNTFKRLLAFALVTSIISQTFMNLAVAAGAIPATGVPLPFFSAGGSSLLMT
ncbi:MAG: putative lipid II flippase FtsW, partial [Spirochaetaceae bacterium]|nr:putative lipid II flippase FtsW [Spirochaetaceae bacterium]